MYREDDWVMPEAENREKKKTKTVFLDRDGTLNVEVNYLYRPEDLKLIPGVPEAIRELNEAGFRVVVVTNQAGVARGYYTEADVDRLHGYLNEVLARDRAHVDAFYYCPHHPEHGIGIYKTECRCRKPKTGMFEAADRDCPVDRERSFMVGDKLIDTVAGHNFGIRSILVGTGYGAEQREQGLQGERKTAQRDPSLSQGLPGKESTAYDWYAADLREAARFICRIDREAV